MIAGKLTGPRKRTEKFVAGYIKHCGKPVEELVDVGYARAKKKLGIIGVKVRIMPPGAVLPDKIAIESPKLAAAGVVLPHEVSPQWGLSPESKAAASVPVQTETTAQEVEKIIAESHAAEAATPAGGEAKPAAPKPKRTRKPPRRDGGEKTEEPKAEAKAEAPSEEPKRDE